MNTNISVGYVRYLNLLLENNYKLDMYKQNDKIIVDIIDNEQKNCYTFSCKNLFETEEVLRRFTEKL